MAVKRQMVVFKIGLEEFAVDIALTKEVVILGPITAVPETHEYVVGVMNLRGNLIPVLDLRRRLRAGLMDAAYETGLEARIIIVRTEGKLAGLIVDGASEVVRITDDMIEPAPDVITEMGVEYIAGVINLGDRYVTLFDLEKALKGDITHELDSVRAALHSALPVASTRESVRA